MPHIITLPGTRDGPDNIFARQDVLSGTYVVASGARAYGSLPRLLWSDTFGSFRNDGIIWNISQTNISAAIGGTNVTFVENRGLIVSENPTGNADGVYVGSRGSYIENYGRIYAIANGIANGVVHWDPNAYIYNSGIIAAYAPTGSQAGVGSATGLAMFNGGTFENAVGASVLAEGLYATALIFTRGALFDTGAPQIRNAGLIEAYSLDPAHPSVAIVTSALQVETMRIVNSGTIRADIFYRSEAETYSPPQNTSDQIINLAGGEIVGLFDTRLGPDRITNSGIIRGDMRLGEGDDFFDTRSGIWVGIADLGWGSDSFLGSAGDDKVMGGRDGDYLEGGAGQDLLLGGLGGDRIVGGTGNDGLYGEYGDDYIVTSGGDIALGAAGDDVVEIGDLSFAKVDGGAGNDRLVLGIGAVALDLALAFASNRIFDFEAIEFRGNQRLIVRAGDVSALTAGESALSLDTTSTDRVELIGGWIEGPAAAGVRQFSLAGETISVRGGAVVSIGPSPSAPGAGLDAISSGPAAPAIDSQPGVSVSNPVSILNWYELHGTETIESYEIWRSEGGLPVITGYVTTYSLINYGRIESTGSGGIVEATRLTNFNSFENHGTVSAVATGQATAYGFRELGFGRFVNYGLVLAQAQAGRAESVNVLAAWGGGINFLNHGEIRASNDGADVAIAASVSRGTSGFNTGLISAIGGNGTIALALSDEQSFTNSGVIEGTRATGANGSAIGVSLNPYQSSVALLNTGSIRGDKAIVVSGSSGFALVTIDNRGQIIGSIELGDRADRFDNHGSIVGDARLGAGVDGWFGGDGQHQGAVFGSDGNDILLGAGSSDRLNGDAGDDLIVGGGGGDLIDGGAGRDIFVYERPSDSTADAFDTISNFESGIDRIDVSALGATSVSLDTAAGYTLLSVVTPLGTLAVHVTGAIALSDLVTGAAGQISGTSGADLLHATATGSTLLGGDGDDVLVGAAGNDRLDGGSGTDVLAGGVGDDIYVVVSGADLIWELPSQGHDRIELDWAGNLFTMAANVEDLTMLATGYVHGNALGNVISGSAGDDTLWGEGGNDGLNGGAGNDRLFGGTGQDHLTGGAGSDTFAFGSISDSYVEGFRSDGAKMLPDVILDFRPGQDKIDLSEIVAVAGGDVNSAFNFIGAAAFGHHAGELRAEARDGWFHVYGDVDGDGLADMHIVIASPTLQASDFLL